MSEVDWTNHEAVVRAAVPDVMSSTKDHCSFAQAKAYMRGAYDEKVWKNIRESYPAVQEFERAYNPAFALPSAADLDAHAEEQRVREATAYHFHGKPMDSECFYGFHAQCHGCNCSCHDTAALPALPVAQEDAFEAWASTQPISLERAHVRGVKYRFDETEYAWLAWESCAAHMVRDGG